jgi:hypothetical protein
MGESMTLTAEQHQIAAFIDQAVSRYPDTEQGTEALLQNLHDHMAAFKRLMDISTTPEMNQLGARYPHFYRLAKLMEQLTEAIAAGQFDDVLGKK